MANVGWLSMAHYQTTAGPSVIELGAPPAKAPAVNLADLSIAEIKAFVNAGELTAEEVFASESAAAKPRKALLSAYAPEASDEASE